MITFSATKHVINPEREKLANAISSLFTDKERAYLESIDPDKQYEVMRFDKNCHATSKEEVKGQQLRDDLVLVKAYDNKDRLDEAQRKQFNMDLYGHEDGPRNAEELEAGQERVRKAREHLHGRRYIQGNGKDAEIITREMQEENHEFEKSQALDRKELENKQNGVTVSPAMEVAQAMVRKQQNAKLSSLLGRTLKGVVESAEPEQRSRDVEVAKEPQRAVGGEAVSNVDIGNFSPNVPKNSVVMQKGAGVSV